MEQHWTALDSMEQHGVTLLDMETYGNWLEDATMNWAPRAARAPRAIDLAEKKRVLSSDRVPRCSKLTRHLC